MIMVVVVNDGQSALREGHHVTRLNLGIIITNHHRWVRPFGRFGECMGGSGGRRSQLGMACSKGPGGCLAS